MEGEKVVGLLHKRWCTYQSKGAQILNRRQRIEFTIYIGTICSFNSHVFANSFMDFNLTLSNFKSVYILKRDL